jgi:hypothetical protein
MWWILELGSPVINRQQQRPRPRMSAPVHEVSLGSSDTLGWPRVHDFLGNPMRASSPADEAASNPLSLGRVFGDMGLIGGFNLLPSKAAHGTDTRLTKPFFAVDFHF